MKKIELKNDQYSNTKLSMHKQCPRKFKYRYVLKIPEREADKSALFKGIRIHNLLEKYPSTDDVKSDLASETIVSDFMRTDLGMKYFNSNTLQTQVRELKIKMNLIRYEDDSYELIPQSEEKDKDVSFVGYIDYINIIDINGKKILNLIDWKTGKGTEQKYQDYDQLMFYQIYFFKNTDVDEIRISFCYVEKSFENDFILERKYLQNYEKNLIDQILEQEKSKFEPIRDQLCDWCPYQKICSYDKS